MSEASATEDPEEGPSEPEPSGPSLRARIARWVGHSLFWPTACVVALLSSAAYHLQLPLAGHVAIDVVTVLVNREIRGHIAIGEMQNVSWEKLVARGVVVTDERGRVVIRLARVAAWPDFEGLLDGHIRVSRVRARGGEVVLYVAGEDEDTVSIGEAFMPVRESDDDDGGGSTVEVSIDNIVLDEITVHGDVPGFEGLRVEDVWLQGDVQIGETTIVSAHDGRGMFVAPYRGRTSIDRITGRINSDLTDGMTYYARIRRGDDRVRARLDLTQPADDPDAPLDMNLRVEVEPIHMSTLAEMEVAPGLDNLEGTFRGHARLWGTDQRAPAPRRCHERRGSHLRQRAAPDRGRARALGHSRGHLAPGRARPGRARHRALGNRVDFAGRRRRRRAAAARARPDRSVRDLGRADPEPVGERTPVG